MADFGFSLGDMGAGFTIISDDMDADIGYGEFALTLINTDYQAMADCISYSLQNNHALRYGEDLERSGHFKDHTPTAYLVDLSLKPLYKDLAQVLSVGYLNEYQVFWVAWLLATEIRNNIIKKGVDLSEPSKYIPSIFSDKALHEHIRNLLLRKPVAFNSPLQDRLNGVGLSSTLVVTNTGEVIPAYHLKDTLDYLVIDLQKYLSSSNQVNECQCCHRLFYPKIRKTEKYCRLPHRDTHLLCNKIVEQQKKSNDKFAVARDKARGYQHQQIYRDWKEKGYSADFVRQLYDDWTNECSTKVVEYRSKGDLQGFTDWLESTKFTAKELKRLWAEYQANGSTPYHTSAED